MLMLANYFTYTGTDILDWIMTNLDGASSVEQARVSLGYCSILPIVS